MEQVTVKYIGEVPKVVNGTTWYPGETWKIDPRLVFALGIQDLVEVQGEDAPKELEQQARYGVQTPASAPEPTQEVVFNRSVLPEAVRPPQGSNKPKVKKG